MIKNGQTKLLKLQNTIANCKIHQKGSKIRFDQAEEELFKANFKQF